MQECSFPNFEAGATCQQCGYVLRDSYPAGFRRPCGHVRQPRRECPHLREPTGDVALIVCDTCTGRVRIKYPIYGCAIHGECLPTYTGEDAPHQKCHGCPDNPANRAADQRS